MTAGPGPGWLAGVVDLRAQPLSPAAAGLAAIAPPGTAVPPFAVWSDGPASIGLAGQAPLRRDGIVVALAGRIDEWRGGPPPGDRDADRLIAAYRRRGPQMLESLVGRFALALWDVDEQALLLARDAMNHRLLVWRRDGDTLRFASTVEQLLPGDEPFEPDEAAVAWHLTLGQAELAEHSFHARVRRLRGGWSLTARRGSVTVTAWRRWTQQPPTRSRSASDPERIRALIDESTRVRFDDGVPAVMLSGGLDSSAVAAAAAGVARSHGLALPRAYTIRFHRHASADEIAYSGAVCAHLGIDQVDVDCDERWTLSDIDELTPWLVEPAIGPYDGTLNLALERAAADGHRVALWGHGGDAIGGLGSEFVADWVRAGRFGDAYRELRAQSRTLGESLARRIAAAVVFPHAPGPLRTRILDRRNPTAVAPWIDPRLAAMAHGAKALLAGRRRREHWWWEFREGLLDDRLGPPQGAVDRRARRFGLRLEPPLSDERLIDALLELPADALYRGGVSRCALRDAIGPDYPPIVAGRRDKAVLFGLAHEGLRSRRPDLLRTIAAAPLAAERGWIDAAALREGVDCYLAGEDRLWFALWRTITLELWLRTQAGRKRAQTVPLTPADDDDTV